MVGGAANGRETKVTRLEPGITSQFCTYYTTNIIIYRSVPRSINENKRYTRIYAR